MVLGSDFDMILRVYNVRAGDGLRCKLESPRPLMCEVLEECDCSIYRPVEIAMSSHLFT